MSSHNRSAPPQGVIPVLAYGDVREAVDWLTRVFRSPRRSRSAITGRSCGRRGAVIVADATYGRRVPAPAEGVTHSTMVRVRDIDAHHRRAASRRRGDPQRSG